MKQLCPSGNNDTQRPFASRSELVAMPSHNAQFKLKLMGMCKQAVGHAYKAAHSTRRNGEGKMQCTHLHHQLKRIFVDANGGLEFLHHLAAFQSSVPCFLFQIFVALIVEFALFKKSIFTLRFSVAV